MKKWSLVIILGCAQFVMVLDSTVMNVSISTVVRDLHTTVAAMQSAITFYTLTMAALMMLGAKLGDIWGRRKAFMIGAGVYALGSLITGLSPNIATLFIGWSVIEGLGAVLVIPAIAALIAVSYKGTDRVKAFAIIGAVSGAAAAAGPLIGGFVSTYLSWRYIFFAEVVIMIIILIFNKFIVDIAKRISAKVDVTSVVLSAAGLVMLVYGMLQSKVWGWIIPRGAPEINGHSIKPFGISLVAYLILVGIIVIKLFYNRQQKLEAENKNPLLKVSVFSIKQLRSGLSVLLAQYTMIAGIFFVIPVYLQMTLGYDALKTGIKIFPLSIGLLVFSVIGARLATKWSPKKIIRFGQIILIVSAVVLLSSVSLSLRGWLFGTALFFAGAAFGLLLSQIGNVNMSSVDKSESSEIGGLQGVFQNLGSSLGTALIGSILIASLTTTFLGNVQSSNLPSSVKSAVSNSSTSSVPVIPVSQVDNIAKSKGLSPAEGSQLTSIYSDSQVSSLRVALYGLIFVSLVSLFFSKNIPDKIVT